MSKQAVIQMALASWLEDAEDLELIERRRSAGAFLSLDEAERALEEGNRALARAEAKLVLELQGITSKQRQDARRLMRTARDAQPRPQAEPNNDP